ncbi:MAG TPA: hypothetical protein VN734_13260 [Acidobacteriaceae bacterium]|nr:hypothetical protein [Acidobacteriaceae bacterium]
MKTLTIALCLLLVVLPASAQQIAGPPPPNFYVPYAVRDVGVNAMELESSSAEMWTPDPGQRYHAPMPRPYPMRRGRYRRFRPGYGPQSPPQESTAAVIAGAVLVVVALATLAAGDH